MPGNIINLNPADIAKWPHPNYIDPDRRAWMPEYAGVLYCVATLLAGTRLWLRFKRQAGGLGLDDGFLIGAWISTTWFTALSIVGSERFMTSRHMWDVPVDGYENIAKITWIAELAFLVGGCCIKVSVLLFYRRLVENTCSRYWIWAVIFAISFTVAYTLGFILTLVFNCTPTDAYWKAFSPTYTHDYSCVNTSVLNLLAGMMAGISDLYSVVLPCLMTRNLQLPQRQKIALYVLFSIGLLVVGASAARTYYLYEVGHKSDVSSCIFNVFLWSQLELCLGIICASVPSLRVFFREYLSQPLSKLKRSVASSRRRDSDIEDGTITRPQAMGKFHRIDFHAKHSPPSSIASVPTPITEPQEPVSPTTWTMTEHQLVKTPADYESYNLHNMEKYRQSTQLRRSSEWSRRTEERELHNSRGKSWLNTEDHD